MSTDRPPQPHPEDDDDATGIRALLASLPDPGPMPPDLVARISASIAAEQAALDRDEAPRPVVTPLVRRRPLWQRAGLVAAGLLVVGIVGSPLLGTSPSDVAARFTTSGTDSAASAAEDAGGDAGDAATDEAPSDGATPDSDVATPEQAPELTPDGSSPVLDDRTTVSGTAYTVVALAGQARTTLDRWLRGLQPRAGDTTSVLGTPEGVEDCLAALLLSPDALVGADLGTLDGEPAALLVVRSGTGTEAYAVRQDCRTGAPGVLAGPVAVP